MHEMKTTLQRSEIHTYTVGEENGMKGKARIESIETTITHNEGHVVPEEEDLPPITPEEGKPARLNPTLLVDPAPFNDGLPPGVHVNLTAADVLPVGNLASPVGEIPPAPTQGEAEGKPTTPGYPNGAGRIGVTDPTTEEDGGVEEEEDTYIVFWATDSLYICTPDREEEVRQHLQAVGFDPDHLERQRTDSLAVSFGRTELKDWVKGRR